MEKLEQPKRSCTMNCPLCDIYQGKNCETFEEAAFAWFDNHPNIIRDYLFTHASPNVVDDLLRVASFKSSKSTYLSQPGQRNYMRLNSLNMPHSKSVVLPMRKISSNEFEALAFQPILSIGQDGCKSFLASPTRKGLATKREALQKIPSESISSEPVVFTTNGSLDRDDYVEEKKALAESLSELTASDLMQELVLDIWNDSDLTSLCFKILKNACLLLNADRASLFMVEMNSSTGERILMSKLFDVTSKCSLSESLAKSASHNISLPFGVGILGWVAQTGEVANISNVYEVNQHFKLCSILFI